MTTIPKTPGQLAAWIEILGTEFAENIKKHKWNFICLDHIENGEKGSPYRLPKNVNNIPLVNSKPQIRKTDGCKVCRYCGVSRPCLEMTRVPSNPEQLSNWIRILGPKFAENIKKRKSNRICLDHIENRDRGNFRLPKRIDNVQKLISDDDDDEEIDEELAQKKTEKNHDRKSERLAKQKRIDYTFGDDEIGEDKEEKEVIKKQNEEIEGDDEENEKLELHVPMLDSETVEIEIQNQPDHSIMKLEMEEQDDDCVEIVPPKCEELEPNLRVVNIQVQNQSNFTGSSMNNDLIRCRVCSGLFNKIAVTETPTDPEEMQKWFKILGPNYIQNIVQNPPPHFICINDLRELVKELCQKE